MKTDDAPIMTDEFLYGAHTARLYKAKLGAGRQLTVWARSFGEAKEIIEKYVPGRVWLDPVPFEDVTFEDCLSVERKWERLNA
jgi:hypothetical protein